MTSVNEDLELPAELDDALELREEELESVAGGLMEQLETDSCVLLSCNGKEDIEEA